MRLGAALQLAKPDSERAARDFHLVDCIDAVFSGCRNCYGLRLVVSKDFHALRVAHSCGALAGKCVQLHFILAVRQARDGLCQHGTGGGYCLGIGALDERDAADGLGLVAVGCAADVAFCPVVARRADLGGLVAAQPFVVDHIHLIPQLAEVALDFRLLSLNVGRALA